MAKWEFAAIVQNQEGKEWALRQSNSLLRQEHR